MATNPYLRTLVQPWIDRYRPVLSSLVADYRRNGVRPLVDRGRLAAARLLIPAHPAHLPTEPLTPSRHNTDPANSAALVNDILSDLALRDSVHVDAALAELDRLYQQDQDPELLQVLYRLDHLISRLRRDNDKKLVLAGHTPVDDRYETASVYNVLHFGIARTRQYERVQIGELVRLAIVGNATKDVARLVSELVDNALRFSPPQLPVLASARQVENGVLLRIEDSGIGLTDEKLHTLNAELTGPPTVDSTTIEHMGLAAVRVLAHRYGLGVRLGKRAPNGTTASVLLPSDLVCDLEPEHETMTMRPAQPRQQPTPPRLGERPRPAVHGVTEAGLPRRPRRTPSEADTPGATADNQPGSGGRHALRVSGKLDIEEATTANGLPIRTPVMQSVRPLAPTAAGQQGWPQADLASPEELAAEIRALTAGEEQALSEMDNTTVTHPKDPS
jgi:hypothetical protein